MKSSPGVTLLVAAVVPSVVPNGAATTGSGDRASTTGHVLQLAEPWGRVEGKVLAIFLNTIYTQIQSF